MASCHDHHNISCPRYFRPTPSDLLRHFLRQKVREGSFIHYRRPLNPASANQVTQAEDGRHAIVPRWPYDPDYVRMILPRYSEMFGISEEQKVGTPSRACLYPNLHILI